MFRFAHPLWLLALIAFPVLILIQRRRVRPATLQYSDVSLAEGLPRSARLRLHWAPALLRFVGMGLLVLAMARPQSGRTLEVIRGRGVDIVMALDISGSMAALDFEPQNRLGQPSRSSMNSLPSGNSIASAWSFSRVKHSARVHPLWITRYFESCYQRSTLGPSWDCRMVPPSAWGLPRLPRCWRIHMPRAASSFS